jgi:hypothetical protein
MKRLLRYVALGISALSFLGCLVPPGPTAQASRYSQPVEGLSVHSLIEGDREKLEVYAVETLRKPIAMSNLPLTPLHS